MNNTAKKSTSQVRTNLLWRVRIDRQKLVSYQSLIKFIKTTVFISPTRGRSLSWLYWLVYQIIMATPGLPTQAAFQVPISTCHICESIHLARRGEGGGSLMSLYHDHGMGMTQEWHKYMSMTYNRLHHSSAREIRSIATTWSRWLYCLSASALAPTKAAQTNISINPGNHPRLSSTCRRVARLPPTGHTPSSRIGV